MECTVTPSPKYAYLLLCSAGERQQASASKVRHAARKRHQPVGAVEPDGFWDLEELRSSEGEQLPQQREHWEEAVWHFVCRFRLLLPRLDIALF